MMVWFYVCLAIAMAVITIFLSDDDNFTGGV